MPNITRFGGGVLQTNHYTVSTMTASDDTSRTLTVPSTTKFILVTGYYEHGANDKTLTVNGQIVGIISKVGDSVTIDSDFELSSGRLYSVSSTVAWTNKTTISISRSSTTGAIQVYACE